MYSERVLQKWSPYLASMAADWADRCDWRHGQPYRDLDELVTRSYRQIGQNLFVRSSNAVDLDGFVQSWYNENRDYDYDAISCRPGAMCGHYTQVGLRQVVFVLSKRILSCLLILTQSITMGDWNVCVCMENHCI